MGFRATNFSRVRCVEAGKFSTSLTRPHYAVLLQLLILNSQHLRSLSFQPLRSRLRSYSFLSS